MLYFPLNNPYGRFIWPWWKHWLDPRTYWNTVVVIYQRATRGWAYCDTWGLDSYVCDVIVPALEHLKETTHGFPVPDDAVIDPDTGDATHEEYERWQTEWDARLDEMIAGFKAAQEVLEGPPERFFPKRPVEEVALDQLEADREAAERANGFQRWVSPYDYDKEGYEAWTKEREEVRQKGFETFTKYFYSLWD